jgi:hypothetical protein
MCNGRLCITSCFGASSANAAARVGCAGAIRRVRVRRWSGGTLPTGRARTLLRGAPTWEQRPLWTLVEIDPSCTGLGSVCRVHTQHCTWLARLVRG